METLTVVQFTSLGTSMKVKKCFLYFIHLKSILIQSTIMHNIYIILPRSTQQNMTTIHRHNITQNFIIKGTNFQFCNALFTRQDLMLIFHLRNMISVRMLQPLQLQFFNQLFRCQICRTSTINNHLATFLYSFTSCFENISSQLGSLSTCLLYNVLLTIKSSLASGSH